MNEIFVVSTLEKIRDNEYHAAKVIIHPKYNNALYDLAVIKE